MGGWHGARWVEGEMGIFGGGARGGSEEQSQHGGDGECLRRRRCFRDNEGGSEVLMLLLSRLMGFFMSVRLVSAGILGVDRFYIAPFWNRLRIVRR